MKWYVFREDCFEKFFTQKDFSDKACIKITFSKVIGFVIVAGSAILKVPQIMKILNSSSVTGLNQMSTYIEVSNTKLLK